MRRLLRAWLALALAPAPAAATDPKGPAPADAPTYTVDVRERRPVTAASSFVVDSKSFELRVLDEPGDLLEVTPGLYVAQHAGGGKANQYLVRGFDADHGTDLAISVDDVPVNMRSHAHGQGYSDLNFVIPETIESVEITKGPYEAEDLDFATAGSVNLVTRERIDESYVRFEGGSYDSQRYLALLSPRTGIFEGGDDAPARALFAFDAVGTDGPFHNEEDLWQYKGLARLGFDLGERTSLESTTQFYRGDWDASNEIPKRLVDGPGFDRWDAVDASDGGHSTTTRTLLRLVHQLSEREQLEAAGWFAWYDLELHSNFTFFLDDPVNGDQIVQRDQRRLYGGWLTYARDLEITPIPVVLRGGLWTRSDDAAVRLGHTRERDFLSTTSYDHVRETSLAGWAELDALPLPWLRTVLGLRSEEFWYDVGDHSGLGRPDGHERNDAALPKASLILRPFAADAPLASELAPLREFELFLNYGQGIHSNDARDVVANGDEVTLPQADGYEVGVRTRFFERLDVAVAYWWLNSESEFVFVGDAGTTEAKPSSRRQGVELSSEFQILEWLFWRGDLAYSSGEFENGDKIPQSVRFIANTSLIANHPSGVSAELDYLTLGERYGTESVSGPRLRSWGVWNTTLRYRRGPIEVAFQVENLFDSDWEAAEFFFPSRLPGEPAGGVDDLHFVPGNSRNFRGWISFYF